MATKNKYQRNPFMTSLIGNRRLIDTDNDYIPNVWDCAPYDSSRHGWWSSVKSAVKGAVTGVTGTKKTTTTLTTTPAKTEVIVFPSVTGSTPSAPAKIIPGTTISTLSRGGGISAPVPTPTPITTTLLTPQEQAIAIATTLIKTASTPSERAAGQLALEYAYLTPSQKLAIEKREREKQIREGILIKGKIPVLTTTDLIPSTTTEIPLQPFTQQPIVKTNFWDYVWGGIRGTAKEFRETTKEFIEKTSLPEQPETPQRKDLKKMWSWIKPGVKKGTEAAVAVIGYFPEKYAESKKIREQIELEYVTGVGAPMTPKQQKQVDIATQLGIFHIPKEDITEKEIKKDFPFAATEYLTGKKKSQYYTEIEEFVKKKAEELSPKIEEGQPTIFKKGEEYIYKTPEGERKATSEEISFYKTSEKEFQEKLLKEVQPELEKKQKELEAYGKKTEISTRWRRAVETAVITVPVYAGLGFVGGVIPAVGYATTGLYTAYSLTHMPQIKQSFIEAPGAFAIGTGIAITGGLIGYSLAKPVPKITLSSIERRLGYPKIDVKSLGVQQKISPPREGLQRVATIETYRVTTKHLFGTETGIAKSRGVTDYIAGTKIIAGETKLLGLYSRFKGYELITGKKIYAPPVKYSAIAGGLFEPTSLILSIKDKYGTVSKEFPGSRGYVISRGVYGKDLLAATLKEGKLIKFKSVGGATTYDFGDSTFFFKGKTKIAKDPLVKGGILQTEKWGTGNVFGLVFKELITPDETTIGGILFKTTKPKTKPWDLGTTTKPSTTFADTITKTTTMFKPEEALKTSTATTGTVSAIVSQTTATRIYPSFVLNIPATKKIQTKTLDFIMPGLTIEKTKAIPIIEIEQIQEPVSITKQGQGSITVPIVIPRVIPKEKIKEELILEPPTITPPFINIPGFALFPGFIKPRLGDERLYGKKQIKERGYKYTPTLTGVMLGRTIKIAPSPKKVWGGYEIRPVVSRKKLKRKVNIFGL